MKDIKNVIFDLGGVLVDLDIERCTAAFRELGMNRVAGLINPCYPAEMIGRLERGDLSFHEACDAMRKLDGRYDVTDAQIAGAYGAFLAGVPVWKLRQVERLRGAGIRTYVLSNNNPASMEVIRGEFTADGHTMDDYFDKVYLSYELRELKPSEAIFRKVIADSGIVPAQTLFIDDGQKNVDAAQALGFAVYKPAPGEDFGHLLEEITATKYQRRPECPEAGPQPGKYGGHRAPAERQRIRIAAKSYPGKPPVSGKQGGKKTVRQANRQPRPTGIRHAAGKGGFRGKSLPERKKAVIFATRNPEGSPGRNARD